MPLPPSNPTKAPPPRLNAAATCTSTDVSFDTLQHLTNSERIVDSFLHSKIPPPLQSPHTASSSRSVSPILPNNGRISPYQVPRRTATSPLPATSPSPDMSISQDSAFPPFPTPKSRSATPTTPSEPSFVFPKLGKPLDSNKSDFALSPTNSWGVDGDSVSYRKDHLAPGAMDKGGESIVQHRQQPLGHAKTPHMGKIQGVIRPSSSGSTKSHDRRPSTSNSTYTRNLSVSSASGSARPTLERSKTEIPAVPTVSASQKVPQQEKSDNRDKISRPIDSTFDFGSFGQEQRSQTFPKDVNSNTQIKDQAAFHRRPSEPSVRSHKPNPSVAAVLQPLHEIGSTSSFKPSKSLRGRNGVPPAEPVLPSTTSSISERRDNKRLGDPPPLPINTNLQNHILGKSYHTPHESTSSNDSYSSGLKSGSSRSSPPLNDSPLRSVGPSSVQDQVNDLFNGFQFDVERRPSFEEPSGLEVCPLNPSIVARPNASPHLPYEEKTRESEFVVTSPQHHLASSAAPPSDYLRVSPTPTNPPPISMSSSSSPQRPRTANKGNCRGCGELIKGKSVSSADGRLTGRYHKQCFVCKTCQAPFQTADFYVMQNHPYCARHYHELNKSLCKSCDRGIEGQYLQTDQRLKFHPHCFSCQECHRILRDDYFEWNGRTLCEQHAFRAAQQPSSLGPGRRNPERRTTRLMMM